MWSSFRDGLSVYCDSGKKNVFISSESYFCCGSGGVILEVNDFSKLNSTSVGALIREYGPVRYLTPVVRAWFREVQKSWRSWSEFSANECEMVCSVYLHMYWVVLRGDFRIFFGSLTCTVLSFPLFNPTSSWTSWPIPANLTALSLLVVFFKWWDRIEISVSIAGVLIVLIRCWNS